MTFIRREIYGTLLTLLFWVTIFLFFGNTAQAASGSLYVNNQYLVNVRPGDPLVYRWYTSDAENWRATWYSNSAVCPGPSYYTATSGNWDPQFWVPSSDIYGGQVPLLSRNDGYTYSAQANQAGCSYNIVYEVFESNTGTWSSATPITVNVGYSLPVPAAAVSAGYVSFGGSATFSWSANDPVATQ